MIWNLGCFPGHHVDSSCGLFRRTRIRRRRHRRFTLCLLTLLLLLMPHLPLPFILHAQYAIKLDIILRRDHAPEIFDWAYALLVIGNAENFVQLWTKFYFHAPVDRKSTRL